MKSGRTTEKGLTRERVIELLDRINRKLAEGGKTAELYIVGGTAMTLEYAGDRRTDDIDCHVTGDAYEVNEATETIRLEETDLRDDWLNTYASEMGFLPETPDPQARNSYTGSHLTVWTASAERLLAMKLDAARDDDRPDIQNLLKKTGIVSIRQTMEIFKAAFPGKEMPEKSRDVVTKWLEEQRGSARKGTATPTRPRITTPRPAAEATKRTR